MSANSLKKHVKCNICGTNFAQMDNMNKHMASVHEGKKPFKFNVCCAQLVQKNVLNTNVETIHEGKKPFKCDICDARFAKKVALKSHVVASECNTCDCEFNRQMEKVHHGKKFHQVASNVHEGENHETHNQKLLSNTTADDNEFQCPICLKKDSS